MNMIMIMIMEYEYEYEYEHEHDYGIFAEKRRGVIHLFLFHLISSSPSHNGLRRSRKGALRLPAAGPRYRTRIP